MAVRNASDEGAFSFLPGMSREQLRQEIQGFEYLTTRRLFRASRTHEGWSGAFLACIHRDVFGHHFPELAGRTRTGEAIFGKQTGPPWEHIDGLMLQLVASVQDHLTIVRAEHRDEERLDNAFRFAALDHSEMIRIHPFVDGNGRWARIATTVFLFDCGYPIGSVIRSGDKPEYIEALDRCAERNAPGDLADLLVAGYIREMKRRRGGVW